MAAPASGRPIGQNGVVIQLSDAYGAAIVLARAEKRRERFAARLLVSKMMVGHGRRLGARCALLRRMCFNKDKYY